MKPGPGLLIGPIHDPLFMEITENILEPCSKSRRTGCKWCRAKTICINRQSGLSGKRPVTGITREIYNEYRKVFEEIIAKSKTARVVKKRHGNGLKFSWCPECGQKGFYKNGHREHCRCCGFKRILLPGQDF